MIKCKKAAPEDIEKLFQYFNKLSGETKSYFAPHPFDFETITSICHRSYQDYQSFVCIKNEIIIAYAVVKNGLTEGELNRFAKYSIRINEESDYILAPSVADAFQSQGVGSLLLSFVESELRNQGAKKIILWGGVQLRNERAVKYYLKNGFRTLGEFWHDDLDNLDMVKYLNDTPLI
ncbi:MAG: GNAT family N-acetyltransferase [Bacteroidetes bacterium]|nr:MAG: GNAT family N-acetyltransferase [Bacteroidota bacterium]